MNSTLTETELNDLAILRYFVDVGRKGEWPGGRHPTYIRPEGGARPMTGPDGRTRWELPKGVGG